MPNAENTATLETEYVTIDGDVLDAIIYRIYGHGPNALSVILAANPHIRDMPAHLPMGTKIRLVPLPQETPNARISLWD